LFGEGDCTADGLAAQSCLVVGDKVMSCAACHGTTNFSRTESTTKDNAVQLVTWAESSTKEHPLRSGVLFVSLCRELAQHRSYRENTW
jgi:hypothetical protein